MALRGDNTHFLTAKAKGDDDALTMLAHLFRCSRCKRKGVKLIPTPRTMVSFEKMGLSRDPAQLPRS